MLMDTMKNATLCVTFKALASKILQCSEVAEIYKANTGSQAMAWYESALCPSEVLQKDRPEGGSHTSFHSRRVENTQVIMARLNGGALSKLL